MISRMQRRRRKRYFLHNSDDWQVIRRRGMKLQSCATDETYTVRRVSRMEAAAADRSGNSRSLSVNSVSSSEGSAESHVVEQEDIIVLTHDVRSFKEALGKLRRIFHPERDKTETMRVAAHERLGEVLRILRSILEKYPPIQSTELLMTAGTLIQQVKGYNYEDEKSDPSNFFDAIDQLALAFSSSFSQNRANIGANCCNP